MKAAATGVFCTSSGLIVGVGSAPQALTSIARIMAEAVFKRCMQKFPSLTAWVASTQSNDTLVSYDDFPAALRDPESTKYFKVLFAINECPSAILSNGPGDTVAGHIQVTALTQLGYYVQR